MGWEANGLASAMITSVKLKAEVVGAGVVVVVVVVEECDNGLDECPERGRSVVEERGHGG